MDRASDFGSEGRGFESHRPSSSSSSGSSINGDSTFVHFCNELHEGVEFSRGGGRCSRPNCVLGMFT